MAQLIILATSLLVCSIAIVVLAASPQDNLPVPVTGENSGPKYDIDLGSMLNSVEPSTNQISASPSVANKESSFFKLSNNNKKKATDLETNNKDSISESTPGLAIRRLWIYSDPMLARPAESWNPHPLFSRHMLPASAPVESTHMHPFVFMRPSPFRSIFADMFNGDNREDETQDSARPTVTTATEEKEEESRPDITKADTITDSAASSIMRSIDPHQLMLDLLQQALSARPKHFGDFGSSPFSPASSSPVGTSTNSSEQKPEIKTESKEDIVEIDGEKYLRKTVISKHVGENVMFMTKKYVLTPLNATIQDTTTTAPKNETTTLEKRQQESSTPSASSTEMPTSSSVNTTPAATTSVPTTVTYTDPSTTSEASPASPVTPETSPTTPEASPTTSEASSSTSSEALPSTTTSTNDNIEKEGESVSVSAAPDAFPEFTRSNKDRVVKRKGDDHTD